MKKKSFLNKLYKEGKIKLVEPSEHIKASYLKKSESYLTSAKILLKNDKFEETVSMIYYSMYYTVLALFFKAGIKCENHTAAIILTKDIFNIDNSYLMSARKERIDKQYYVDFSVTRLDVQELIECVEHFNSEILDFIARLNSKKIEEFRKKAVKLLKGKKR